MFEEIILSNLIENEEYCRKVIPFLDQEYFHDIKYKIIFEIVNDFFEKYNVLPSKIALKIELSKKEILTDDLFKEIEQIIESLKIDKVTELGWLIDETEKFCQDKSLYNAIYQSIKIIEGKDKKLNKGSIPQLLNQALGVSFDTNIGMDYLEDWEYRYDLLHSKDIRLPFGLSYFNKITKGGLLPKTLNIILAGIHVGKTLLMCNMAASNLIDGKNVLYITMEMSQEQIGERIDAALLDITLDELSIIPKEAFKKKIERVKTKTSGKLVVKEYPTSSAGAANFRHLLHELKQKKNFIPDIIYVDYINICQSTRHRTNPNANSYTIVKAIAEEIRALAVEFNLPIVSATQTTREGQNASDIDFTYTSECLDPKTKVIKIDGTHTNIEEIKPGDKILGTNGFVTVTAVHHPKIKKKYKIVTKSGKEIICSSDHKFPTDKGRKSINTGLSIGTKVKKI